VASLFDCWPVAISTSNDEITVEGDVRRVGSGARRPGAPATEAHRLASKEHPQHSCSDSPLEAACMTVASECIDTRRSDA